MADLEHKEKKRSDVRAALRKSVENNTMLKDYLQGWIEDSEKDALEYLRGAQDVSVQMTARLSERINILTQIKEVLYANDTRSNRRTDEKV